MWMLASAQSTSFPFIQIFATGLIAMAAPFLEERLLIDSVRFGTDAVEQFGAAQHHLIVFQNPAGLPFIVAVGDGAACGLVEEYSARPGAQEFRQDAEH